MDWSDGAVIRRYEADTIMFADCIYNEEGATALCNAIQMILRPKGNVIGVLPDHRVGIDLFENIMESNGFVPKIKNMRFLVV
jgi:predicted nicotinamide N-methyase